MSTTPPITPIDAFWQTLSPDQRSTLNISTEHLQKCISAAFQAHATTHQGIPSEEECFVIWDKAFQVCPAGLIESRFTATKELRRNLLTAFSAQQERDKAPQDTHRISRLLADALFNKEQAINREAEQMARANALQQERDTLQSTLANTQTDLAVAKEQAEQACKSLHASEREVTALKAKLEEAEKNLTHAKTEIGIQEERADKVEAEAKRLLPQINWSNDVHSKINAETQRMVEMLKIEPLPPTFHILLDPTRDVKQEGDEYWAELSDTWHVTQMGAHNEGFTPGRVYRRLVSQPYYLRANEMLKKQVEEQEKESEQSYLNESFWRSKHDRLEVELSTLRPVSLKTRRPTKKDANTQGLIQWHWSNGNVGLHHWDTTFPHSGPVAWASIPKLPQPDTLRQEFEEWAVGAGENRSMQRTSDGKYVYHALEAGWRAWQAARAGKEGK